MGKRIVVTGGAGFLGANLTPRLLERGHEVTIFDNFCNGKEENLDPVRDNPRLTVIRGDVRNRGEVGAAFRGAQVIIHLCCQGMRQGIKDPGYVNEVITGGTLNCLEAAAENRVELFLNASTVGVYGKADYFPIDEEHRCSPRSAYGIAKAAQDFYVRNFGLYHDMPWATIRFTAMYGPHSHWEGFCGEVIPRMIVHAMNGKPLVIFGDGSQIRDFVYAGDAVRALLTMLEAPESRGEVFNFSTVRETTLREVAEIICEHYHLDPARWITHLPARPGDAPRIVCDNTKFRKRFGFTPDTGIREGIGRTIEWFGTLAHPPEKMLAEVPLINWE